MCIAYNVLMCRKESNHPLQRTPLFNSQCSASSGQLDPALDGRMLTYCHHMAVVCPSCCIDVDKDYTSLYDVTSSRDDVTDNVQQMCWYAIKKLLTHSEVCMIMRTAGITRGNLGNGDHIHGNTVGTGSRLTGLPWRWGAMQTVMPW